MTRIERIQEMEQRLDASVQALQSLEKAVSEYEAAQGDYYKLLTYYSSAQWMRDYEADEEGKLLSDPVSYNCDMDLSEIYQDIDYSRGIVAGGKTLIYRETDIISDEVRVETDYYKKVYKPNKWHYALQAVIARRKKFLGVITFYRSIGKEDFRYDDIFVLDLYTSNPVVRICTSFY